MTTKSRKRLPPSARREQILKAALRVLATQGYEKFRFRNVAAHANVHFATIQYHFKSKDALLSALIEAKLARDKALLETAFEKTEGSPKEKFVKAIALMASESQDPLVAGFFLELWALSNHNKTAVSHFREYYQAYFSWVLELITLVNPDLSNEELHIRTVAIMSLLEGIVPISVIGNVGGLCAESLNAGVCRLAWVIAST